MTHVRRVVIDVRPSASRLSVSVSVFVCLLEYNDNNNTSQLDNSCASEVVLLMRYPSKDGIKESEGRQK